MGGTEPLSRDGIKVHALELFTRRVGNGMDQNIETVPVTRECFSHCFNIAILRNIASNGFVRPKLRRELFRAPTELVIFVSQHQVGTLSSHRLGDSPSNRSIGGNTCNERTFTVEESHRSLSLWLE